MWVIWNASHVVHRPTITKRHSSRQAQTQIQRECSARYSRPGLGPKLQGQFNLQQSGKRPKKGHQVFAWLFFYFKKLVVDVDTCRINCRIESYNYSFVSFWFPCFSPEFRRLCWPGRRPQPRFFFYISRLYFFSVVTNTRRRCSHLKKKHQNSRLNLKDE
jgi:hypothetical protein